MQIIVAQVLEPHYDRDEFKEVVKSLHVAGVPAEEQHQMWVVLAAILKLGNVQFAQVSVIGFQKVQVFYARHAVDWH